MLLNTLLLLIELRQRLKLRLNIPIYQIRVLMAMCKNGTDAANVTPSDNTT